VREYRHMALLVDYIHGKSIACFHQSVQIRSTRMYSYPPRVVAGCRRIDATNEGKLARLAIFLVRPDLIRARVRRIKIRFGWIEDHSMHFRAGLVLVILDVRLHTTIFIDGEDVPKACVVIKRVPIDMVRRLPCG
jgi:hypothetical protein